MKISDAAEIDNQIEASLQQHYHLFPVELNAEKSGMNNITRKVTVNNSFYNIRVYCNHDDMSKVRFEHQVIERLASQEMSIRIPVPVKTVNGSTVASLADGRLVALYHYIEGNQQESDELFHSLIEATAYLARAFEKIEMNDKPAYSPYYDLHSNYPTYSGEELLKISQSIDRDTSILNKLKHLNVVRHALEEKRDMFQQLPHNYIHGDINFSNAVVVQEKVIGILDFEFVTYDIRVMELAVLLVRCFKADNLISIKEVNQLIALYTSIHVLTQKEIDCLPLLVQLRAVDVAFHFITRFVEGLDEQSVLIRIIDESYAVVTGVKREWLIE